jgi:hypothetical protein
MKFLTMAARLTSLEARRRPAARIVVCWCGCDLPLGQHKPGCPAAGDSGPVVTIGGRSQDVVLRVVWEQSPITNPNPQPAPSVTQPPAPVASVPAAEVPAVDALVLAAQARVARAYARRSR